MHWKELSVRDFFIKRETILWNSSHIALPTQDKLHRQNCIVDIYEHTIPDGFLMALLEEKFFFMELLSNCHISNIDYYWNSTQLNSIKS